MWCRVSQLSSKNSFDFALVSRFIISNVVFFKYLVLRSRYHVTIYFIRRDSVLYHIFFNGIKFALVNKFKVLLNYASFLVGRGIGFPQ